MKKEEEHGRQEETPRPPFFCLDNYFLLPCPFQKQGGMYSGFKGCGMGCKKTGLGVKTDPLRSNAALMCV